MARTPARPRWTGTPAAYDAWFDRPWGRYASTIEHRLLLRAAGSVTGRIALDAGSGTGRFSHRLEEAGATVISVDIDVDALTIARRRTSGPIMTGDAHALALSDRSVDIAFAVTVCEFAADPEHMVAELARVTRPGGRIVIGSLNRSSPWGWWNRRGLMDPPWSTAMFVSPRTLLSLGAPHGTCVLFAGLFAPAYLPTIDRWSPALERIGSQLAPSHGAFQVMSIQTPL